MVIRWLLLWTLMPILSSMAHFLFERGHHSEDPATGPFLILHKFDQFHLQDGFRDEKRGRPRLDFWLNRREPAASSRSSLSGGAQSRQPFDNFFFLRSNPLGGRNSR